MPKIKIDAEKCIGCCMCETLSPKTFLMKGDKAIVIKASGSDPVGDKDSKDSCPTEAIIIS